MLNYDLRCGTQSDQNNSVACRVTNGLLAYWYSHQQLCVRWHNMLSDYFSMSNGVRQGGIFSILMFYFSVHLTT